MTGHTGLPDLLYSSGDIEIYEVPREGWVLIGHPVDEHFIIRDQQQLGEVIGVLQAVQSKREAKT